MTHGSDRRLNKLSVAATFGLVLMVGATAGFILWPRVTAAIGIKPAPPPPAPPAYAAGQQIDVPAEWYSATPHTLVLFARASCGACDKARPFLKSLITDVKSHSRTNAVMAHPATSQVEDAEFAESIGITGANVRIVTANLRVKATPTLVLVNQTGAILAAWEGVGTPERQTEIKTTIANLSERRP